MRHVQTLFVLLMTCSSMLLAQPTKQQAAVKEVLFPIEGPDPNLSNADFLPLKPLLQDRRIVAMGESTHGTREFFQLKHRMLRFLVEECGFRTFAIEANFSECLIINDYVQNGVGDARSGLKAIYFWVWNTEEVLAMIEWMRKWNVDHPNETQLQFLGFDMQFTQEASRQIEQFLSQHQPALLNEHQDNLVAMQGDHYYRQPLAIKEAWFETGTQVATAIEANAGTWCQDCSDRQLIEIRMHARALQQATMNFGKRQLGLRDSCMAANTRHILNDFVEEGGKMMIWAHNGHLVKTKRNFSYPMQGAWLKEWYGDEMYTIGFDFGAGEFASYANGSFGSWEVEHTNKKSLHTLLDGMSERPFFMDLVPERPSSKVKSFLKKKYAYQSYGAAFWPEYLDKMARLIHYPSWFDGLIFVPQATAARNLKWIEKYRSQLKLASPVKVPDTAEVRLEARLSVAGDLAQGSIWLREKIDTSYFAFIPTHSSDTLRKGGWSEVTCFANSTHAPGRFELGASLQGPGTLWLDDIRLTQRTAEGWQPLMEADFDGDASEEVMKAWKMVSHCYEMEIVPDPADAGNKVLRIQWTRNVPPWAPEKQ